MESSLKEFFILSSFFHVKVYFNFQNQTIKIRKYVGKGYEYEKNRDNF